MTMPSSDFPLPWRQPPGHWTRRGACLEAVRLGLGGGTEAWPAKDWRDQDLHTLWHYWACSPQPVALWSRMLEHADGDLRDQLSRDGAHPWHWLALHGAAHALKQWRETWGTPVVTPWRGDTVLHCAAWSADLKTLKAVTAQAPGPLTVPDAQGVPPLVVAIYRGTPEHVAVLLAAGADPDAQDPAGRSALHHAALLGDADLLGQLEDAGGDAALLDRDGATPMGVLEDRMEISRAQVLALRQHWARRYQLKLRF
jgi:hypothetical protein